MRVPRSAQTDPLLQSNSTTLEEVPLMHTRRMHLFCSEGMLVSKYNNAELQLFEQSALSPAAAQFN
jgi:hypothetical protein